MHWAKKDKKDNLASDYFTKEKKVQIILKSYFRPRLD